MADYEEGAAEETGDPTIQAETSKRKMGEGLLNAADFGGERTIGPYKLLQQIGEGGFGVVYLAEQAEPIRRRVALKILKLGMDSREVLARFEAERQALARMDHPHIARVLDAGLTVAGRSYFVMEYAAGVSITEYSDTHKLNTPQRLELFVLACHAIQHAHHKGVIHRDIKPSNILITHRDGRPVPKIIDFGIAKATDQRLTERTLFTEQGRLLGTPEYMSPEQAELSGLDIDTRTDVYSLGVVLYELLTGALPFDRQTLRHTDRDELRKKIRETEPPKPSTRVSELVEAEAVAAVHGHTDAQTLRKQLRGDLDWITMKALDKDRTRRYATPNDLAADIARHLNHEPVLAGPPGAMYRLRKFIRRNKGLMTAAAAILLALLAGLTAATYGFIQASRERDRARLAEQTARQRGAEAQAEANKLQGVNTFLRNILSSANPTLAVAADMRMRDALDHAARQIEADAPNVPPEVMADVRRTVGNAYVGLGLYEQAEVHLRAALALHQKAFGEEHLATANCLSDLGALFLRKHDEAQAESWLRRALAIQRGAPDDIAGADLASTLANLAGALQAQAKWDAAEKLYREVLELDRKLGPEGALESARTLNALSTLRLEQNAPADAVRLLRESLEIRRTRLGADHWETAISMANLATALSQIGDRAGAEALFREALPVQRKWFGEDHPNTVSVIVNLAALLWQKGDLAAAEPLMREMLAISRKGEDDFFIAASLNNLGNLLSSKHEYAEAERMLREAMEIFHRRYGPDHLESARAARNLAMILSSINDDGRAEPLLRQALAVRQSKLPPEHPLLADSLVDLGELLTRTNRMAEGEPLLRQALELCRRPDAPPRDPERLASYFDAHGQALKNLGRYAEAEAVLLEGHQILEKKLGAAHARTAKTARKLAELYEAWNAAEPGAGKAEPAAAWRAKSAANP